MFKIKRGSKYVTIHTLVTYVSEKLKRRRLSHVRKCYCIKKCPILDNGVKYLNLYLNEQGKSSLSRTDIEGVFALYDRVTLHHHLNRHQPRHYLIFQQSPPTIVPLEFWTVCHFWIQWIPQKNWSKESGPHWYSGGTHNIHFHSSGVMPQNSSSCALYKNYMRLKV